MILKIVFLPQRHKDLFLEYLEAGEVGKYHIEKYMITCTFPARNSSLLRSVSFFFFLNHWGFPSAALTTFLTAPPVQPYCSGFFLDGGKIQENEFLREHLRFNHFLLGK